MTNIVGSINNLKANFNGIILTGANGLTSGNIKNDVSQGTVVATSKNSAGFKEDGNKLIGQLEIQVARGSKAYNIFDNYYKTLSTQTVAEKTASRLSFTQGQVTSNGEVYVSEMTFIHTTTRTDAGSAFEDNGAGDFLVTFTFSGIMPPEKREIRIAV